MIVLLILSLGSTAYLALEAFRSTSRNRAAAESIVRDNARLAGQELVRRGGYEVAYYGFSPALRAIVFRSRQDPEAPLPLPSEIAATSNARQKSGLTLADAAFVMSLPRGLHHSSPNLSAAEGTWLGDAILADIVKQKPADGDVPVIQRNDGGRQETFAYMIISDGTSRVVAALRSDPRRYGEWIRRAYERQPLLPVALGNGTLTNDALFVDLRDGAGAVLFRAGDHFDPQLGIEERANDPTGTLDGLKLRASVTREAIPRMVVGGLPVSRVPQLLLSLCISVALLGAAIFQLQRERALVRLRSDFVSSVSHELRTPLTQIRMFAETLRLDRVRSPEERRRSIVIIDQEARRLAQLVENILLFSQGERGGLRVNRHPVEINPLVADAVESFGPIARAKNVVVITELSDPAVLDVDADAVRQILLNLLDNSVKYGPAGQRITVTTSRQSKAFRIAVRDQGPGIPQDERDSIWKKFRRLDRDLETHRAGTGIGLALVMELMILHGGRAWVDPVSGGGACFNVEFPLPDEPGTDINLPATGSAS
ncbi:MAG: HAMP domain-containing sensor histidine kinase [Acidobacteriota bacterium]